MAASVKTEPETKLSKPEDYYRAIVDASNDAILVIDPKKGEIRDYNARFKEMYAYNESRHGPKLKDLSSEAPYTEEDFLQKIQLASQYGAQIFEWRSRVHHGKTLWVEINLKRVSLGANPAILAYVQDISDRKLTDQSLRESEKKWRSLAENVPDSITMLDAKGTISFVNWLNSKNRRNPIGSSIFEQYPPILHNKIRNAIDKALSGKLTSLDTQETTQDETRSYILRFAPVMEDQQTTGVLVIGTDITDEKSAQTQLMLSQSDLEHKNRSLATIINIADRVYQTLDTYTVAKEAVNSIIEYKFSSSIAFFLIDKANQSMELIYSLGMGESDYQTGYKLPLQGTISALTTRNKTVTNIVDFTQESQLDPKIRSSLTQHGFQSCYSIPLLFQSEVIGAMTLLFHNNQKISDNEHQTLLHIGKTVGLALANARYVAQIQLEIKERQYAEESVRNIAIGISSATGDAFCRAVVENIAKTFDLAYAFIGNLTDDGSVSTIAVHSKKSSANFQYALKGTPCENVAQGELCAYEKSVQSLFPDDALLKQMGVESYMGTPLFESSGRIFGILVLMDTKPLEHTDLLASALRIVANRASAEIERLKAEQALRLSEEHLRLALKASNVATWEWEIDANRMKWSENISELLGVSGSDTLDTLQSFLRLINKDDHQSVQQAFQNSVTFSSPISIQHRLNTQAHQTQWLAIQGEIVLDADGTPSLMRGTISDITERQRVQLELQQSKNMLQTVLDTIPSRVYWKDRHSKYLGCNKIFAQDVGLQSPDQILGKSDRDLTWTDQARQYEENDRKVIESGHSVLNREEVKLNQQEKTVWLNTSKIPLTDIEGNTIGVLGTYDDITERKMAVEEKHQSQQKLELHFQQTPLAVIDWDVNFKVRNWNPAAEKIFSYTKHEAIGKHAKDLILDDSVIAHVDAVWTALLTNRGGERSTNKNITKDGAVITCEWYNTPLVARDGQIIGVTSIVQDITSRINDEHELKVYRRHLEELVEKRTDDLTRLNRELEAFSYSVSHDLRAPLRSIDGFSQALLEDYGSQFDLTALDYLQRVRKAAQRMSTLIDDLLQLSRLTRSKLRRENVNLSALAGDVVDKVMKEANKRQVDLFIRPKMVAQGDEGLLRVVLDNLINNALKYTSYTKVAKIRVDQIDQDKETVFFVRDNGAGFNMEYVDKLFSAFQRLHKAEDFEGNGIGLATVARIIHRHGGRVWAEGEVNRGATFYFTIPDKG